MHIDSVTELSDLYKDDSENAQFDNKIPLDLRLICC